MLQDYPGPGYYTEWTLAEIWNGSTWAHVSTPDYWPDAEGDWLTQVSCTSSTFCLATGEYVECPTGDCFYEQLADPFIEEWNGSSWQVVEAPSVVLTTYNWLGDISCVSSTDCVAVGDFEDATTDTWYGALYWNGTSWIEESDGAGAGSSGVQGVECKNVANCISVSGGSIDEDESGAWVSMNPPSVSGASLQGITCLSSTFCEAVGYVSATGYPTLVEQWNGTSWSVVSSPSPGSDNYLYAVSCSASSLCFADGNYYSSLQVGLIEAWNGNAWSISSTPSITSLGTQLPSVSCVTSTFCVAAGSYMYGDIPSCSNCQLYDTMLDSWNGSTWSLQFPLSGGPITSTEEPTNNQCFVCSLRAMGQAYGGDPVNTEFGNLTESATDISIPGRGIPLSFFRTYDSLDAGADGPFGYGWTFNWSMSLNQPGGTGPVTITQEDGAQSVFDPSGTGYVPAAPREIATLTHNSDGTWTFSRLAQDTFTFSSTGQLVSERDRNGYTTTLTYNGSGQATTVTDPSGRTLQIGWTGSNITSVTDANVTPNRVVRYEYDSAGDLTDVIDVNGGHTHYGYNSKHQLTNLYDPNCYAAGSACNGGGGVMTDYNASGQVDWQEDQLGRKTTFAYSGDPASAAGGTTTTTDPKGNVTVDSYQFGVRVQETQGYGTPEASTRQWIYDPQSGAPITEIAPNNEITQLTADANGNILTTVDPSGRRTSATYNSFNEPLTKTDGNGVTTTYTYDSNGNLLTTATPLLGTNQTQTTSYTYGDSSHPGDVTAITDPDSNTTKYTYDAYGDQMTVTDPLGDVSTTCYNAAGWKLAAYTAKAGTINCGTSPPSSPYETQYSYLEPNAQVDEFGDVQSVTDPLGHTTKSVYDADRNVVSKTDGDGNTSTYVYDLAGELTDVRQPGGADQHTDYNADGTVLDQKDGKGDTVEAYSYDALGRMTAVKDALGNVTAYTYDLNGQPAYQAGPRRQLQWLAGHGLHHDDLRCRQRADGHHVFGWSDPERHQHQLRQRWPTDRDERWHRDLLLDLG
jgi:YD repeat-containing protein